MTRLFYSDPLDAAQMMRHFGMRFVSWHSGKEYEPCVILANAGSPIKSVREGQRYVIHPESLHLLEPQVGDWAWCVELKRPMECDSSEVAEYVRRRGDAWSIFQRNGHAFHWPESEAA